MTIQNIYDAALRILAESDNGDVHYLSTNLDIHMFLGCRFGGRGRLNFHHFSVGVGAYDNPNCRGRPPGRPEFVAR